VGWPAESLRDHDSLESLAISSWGGPLSLVLVNHAPEKHFANLVNRTILRVPGLAETGRDSRPEIPDGIFLVRVDGAQFRWHAHKPFYILRLSVLEPRTLAGQSIVGRLYCIQKAIWKRSCGIFSMTRNFWPTNRSLLFPAGLVPSRLPA
jgi:hypothetical protein